MNSQVTVVGAGAVGLTLAARLAQLGIAVEVFDALPAPARIGSRAICMQRETLEIWHRVGVGERVAERGVQWRIGRTYHRGSELFSVELPGAGVERFPPFVNINQSEVEELLAARLAEYGVPVRWGHRLTAVMQDADGVDATFEVGDGDVTHRSAYLVGADGAHSGVRHALGIGFPGYTFDDRFLIADVRAELAFTLERHFHFDPPWNPGRQVLIHPQPDGVWRIDWQVAPETDLDAERSSGGLERRIREVVGASASYELVWATAYRFSQRIAEAFRVGRAFLAGDAAHVMSPFGARGLNSGVADAENLAWKLAWVLRGESPASLLDSYEVERRAAAQENLRVTDDTMRFMAPHDAIRRAWREVVLRLAPHSAFFRSRVNSGRLAQPYTYAASAIVADGHGHVAPDVPLADGRRLRDRVGRRVALVMSRPLHPLSLPPDVEAVVVGRGTAYGDARAWVVRPDGHVAGSAPLKDPRAIARRVAAAQGR